MNKLMIVLALVMACALGALAGAQSHPGGKSHRPASEASNHTHAIYACPKCEMASNVGGTCPGCKAKMVAIEATMVYACPKCHMVGKKGATCTHCKAKLAASAMTFACEDCHTSSKKPGMCAKCGKKMVKAVLPVMGKG